jgi:hypothetical protein
VSRARLRALPRFSLLVVGSVFLLGFQPSPASTRRIAIPLTCSRGPNGQHHDVAVTVPASVAKGARYTVRVDGVDSGTISHTGLKYIFDMGSEWPVPPGAEYVEGSARIVPGTGSDNVRAGARVVHASGSVRLGLPAHVENGSRYTPPSFEFDLRVASSAAASITQTFVAYRVTAHAFLVGDLNTTCEPAPRPFPVGTTLVESP